MRHIKRIWLILLLTLLFIQLLSAQTEEIDVDSVISDEDFGYNSYANVEENHLELHSLQKTKYGIFADFGLNLHLASFGKLPGVPSCCPEFTSGFGLGYSAGFTIDAPLRSLFDTDEENHFVIGANLGYMHFSGLLISKESATVIIDGEETLGKFEHRLDSKLGSIGFEPFFGYRLTDDMFAYLGVRFGLIVHKEYHQIEKITDPPDRGTFTNGLRERNESSGDLPDVSAFQAGLALGIKYELPLNKGKYLFLEPHFNYTWNFIPIIAGTGWNTHIFRLGAAIKFCEPPPPPPPPPMPLDPPMPGFPSEPNAPDIVASIRVTQLDSANSESNAVNLKIEDFISYNMRPLLTYIFFNENSATIPSRYVLLSPSEKDKFSLKSLQNLEALPTYYQVLNIIGKRLSDNSDAKIRIVGTNSNTGDEKGNKELSLARANAVKNYLQQVWNIPEKQLKVEARNLPSEPSNNDEPGGPDENRRVEIISNDWSITEPVFTVDTIRKITNTTLRFYPNAKAETGIKLWRLTATQKNKTLKEFNGTNAMPVMLDWKIQENDPSAPKTGGDIQYSLTVTDNIGQQITTNAQKLTVEQLTIDKKRLNRISDKEFEFYSLILFDFGKSTLGSEHKKVIDFVHNRVTEASNVIITGYTDMIGEDEVNRRISEARAKSVAKRLNIQKAEVRGAGESELLYDNGLPEGRFYCRTVRITIETPIQE